MWFGKTLVPSFLLQIEEKYPTLVLHYYVVSRENWVKMVCNFFSCPQRSDQGSISPSHWHKAQIRWHTELAWRKKMPISFTNKTCPTLTVHSTGSYDQLLRSTLYALHQTYQNKYTSPKADRQFHRHAAFTLSDPKIAKMTVRTFVLFCAFRICACKSCT